MPKYPKLENLLSSQPRASDSSNVLETSVVPHLLDVWIRDYCSRTGQVELVETSAETFHYLFDVLNQRLVSAWGITGPQSHGARDKSRMQGHPNSYGPLYHRGHAIPHSAGGGLDINLVPQLGSLNIGAFRVLEKRAVASPGSLYFTYWQYANDKDQKPTRVQQGLLRVGHKPELKDHGN